MTNSRHTVFFFVLVLSFLSCSLAAPATAQTAKVEGIGSAPAGAAPPDVTADLADKGYRVVLPDGWTVELWFARELKVATKDVPGALYPGLSNGEFVGVISLPKGMSDFRGQAIPAGTYTLRYHLIPQDANHMGASPNPDFLLAIPAANDPTPSAEYPYRKLVALSSKTTGAHVAVIAMETAGEPGTAVFDDQKMLVFTASVKTSAGEQKLGIVLKGQATQ
jgi:hypothetical protein